MATSPRQQRFTKMKRFLTPSYKLNNQVYVSQVVRISRVSGPNVYALAILDSVRCFPTLIHFVTRKTLPFKSLGTTVDLGKTGGCMFCRQMFSTVSGSSSCAAGWNPSIGCWGTPLCVRTPTTTTPPRELANDETTLGRFSRTLSSNVDLYSTRIPSLNLAQKLLMSCVLWGGEIKSIQCPNQGENVHREMPEYTRWPLWQEAEKAYVEFDCGGCSLPSGSFVCGASSREQPRMMRR